MIYEFWDLGVEGTSPNLGTTSTAKVMKALIKLRGRLIDSTFFYADTERNSTVSCRISLPEGTREMFQRMTGYVCTPVGNVSV